MHFWKMNGAGNDFLVVNNIKEKLPLEKYSHIAKILCERRLSIGADGFMVVDKPTVDADFRLVFLNSDGSLGEMCGNGARCICRYGYENGLSGEIQRVETTAGIVTGERIDARKYRIRLNDPSVVEIDKEVEVDGKIHKCSYVELGNPGIPHVVYEMEDVDSVPRQELFDLGRKLRYHEAFYKGANINFTNFIDANNVTERTYERGVEDFTYACGTGAGSIATVLFKKGLISGKNTGVHTVGGLLNIDIISDGQEIKDIFLTGPTNIVAKGEVTDEELEI